MLNITAHIIAFPKPEMYWQFGQNGLCINVSSGITNSFNINRHSSNIVKRNVVETDFGIYRLYVYNGVGNTQYFLHSFVVLPESKYIINSIFQKIICVTPGTCNIIYPAFVLFEHSNCTDWIFSLFYTVTGRNVAFPVSLSWYTCC
jgi:hypothetical protein